MQFHFNHPTDSMPAELPEGSDLDQLYAEFESLTQTAFTWKDELLAHAAGYAGWMRDEINAVIEHVRRVGDETSGGDNDNPWGYDIGGES